MVQPACRRQAFSHRSCRLAGWLAPRGTMFHAFHSYSEISKKSSLDHALSQPFLAYSCHLPTSAPNSASSLSFEDAFILYCTVYIYLDPEYKGSREAFLTKSLSLSPYTTFFIRTWTASSVPQEVAAFNLSRPEFSEFSAIFSSKSYRESFGIGKGRMHSFRTQ
jgi:hypothetical protein